MKVILLERVGSLGGIGAVVDVRPGYARNFLLPQSKALRATDANLKRFEHQREAIEMRNSETRAEAEAMGARLDGKEFVLVRQSGESGQLYGSVSARDISQAAEEAGFAVTRAMVQLDQPIKTLGVHRVKVRLHPEVIVTVKANVARSADEAERQSKGENVIASAMAEDRALADAQAKEIEAASAETMANASFDQ